MLTCMKKLNKWNFEKKMRVVVSLAISGTSILVLFIFLIVEMVFVTEQSADTIESQMGLLASNYEETLEQYWNFSVALVINDAIQNYCSAPADNLPDSAAADVNTELTNMLNIQNNLNFSAVIRDEDGQYYYKGNTSMTDAQFEAGYEEDYKNSILMRGETGMRMSYNDAYYRSGVYTLTLYYPVYSTTNMVNKMGTIVMNMNDSFMESILADQQKEPGNDMFLVDTKGNVIADNKADQLGTVVPYGSRISGDRGGFWNGGKLVQYQRIGGWSYYLVNEITLTGLVQGSFGIIGMLLIFIALFTLGAIWVVGRLIRQFYRPINTVVNTMGAVEEGRLDVRIDSESLQESDPDSRKLADGFNSMMDEINLLMKQVKEEQHQMEQIRINALQSQIKPHFLYNALECIHWQAVADGNRKISVLVKALAQYYRICLSRGKEIIPFKLELEHVKAYMTIQQMRYGDIIEMELHIPEELDTLKIPKMTLQPLVENSIYHGIRVKEGKKGKVEITAMKDGEDALIIVSDSGTGMESREIEEMNRSISVHDDSFGYGVRNVNKRIELMFGKPYGLKFTANENGGVTVVIRLPLQSIQDENEEKTGGSQDV